METLETIEIEQQDASHLRFPIQLVNRPPMPELARFPRIHGQDCLRTRSRRPDRSLIMPGGRQTQVTGIATFDGERESAFAPQSVTLTLAEDLDVSRGDMIVGIEDRPAAAPRVRSNGLLDERETVESGRKVSPASYHPAGEGDRVRNSIPHRSQHYRKTAGCDRTAPERYRPRLDQNAATDCLRSVSYKSRNGRFLLIDDNNDTAGAGFVETSL